MAYKLGNYEFRTQKEYDEARKELSLVKQIRDKYNISDPKVASQLLATIERGDKIKFKTSIGKAFIELLRKNAKVQMNNNSQVVKSANPVPVKREQSVNTKYTGTKAGWQTEESSRGRRAGGGWQTDSQYGSERKRSAWANDVAETGRNTSYKSDETQQMEKKKVKIKKKDWKEYHTGRKMLLYFLVLVIGSCMGGFLEIFHTPEVANLFASVLGLIVMILFVTIWFGLLRLIYKQATTKRLWCITGYIFAIILVIALCCTGIGAVPVILAWSIIRKAIVGLIPTDDDLGLIEVEIEVPVKAKAKKMFEQFEVTGFKEITEEEYRKYLVANKDDF